MTPPLSRSGAGSKGGGLRSLGLVGLAATPFTCLSQLLLLSGCAAVWGGDEGQALAQPLPCGRPRPTVPQWRREGDEARDLYRGRCVHSVPLLFCGAVEGTWGAWRPRKGPLTLETDYRTARTRGGGPSQTEEDSLTEQPRPFSCAASVWTRPGQQVSAVPEAISAAASTCCGFPGRTEAGVLSRDPKRWLSGLGTSQVADSKRKSSWQCNKDIFHDFSM
ncbi:small nuclear ribonucleoprotein-associated protein N isoform X3 [Rhinolophus ferrumequinum]|uniref:small nuclear ribonucleoprotein-associated protein N isoform X3 n=1 Tax=Rhinolophus ferrumequinum TaxID=59479 RepID=UPI00140F7415|nr:small nuclear ribonucleoprotein-associated protein N isoform X3 [Rhinolophus ferrumequinum]